MARDHGHGHADGEGDRPDGHRDGGETLAAAADPDRNQREEDSERNEPQRAVRHAGEADEDRDGGEKSCDGLGRTATSVRCDAHALTGALRVRAYRRAGRPCGPGLRGRELGRHGVGSESSVAATSNAGCSGRGSDLIAQ